MDIFNTVLQRLEIFFVSWWTRTVYTCSGRIFIVLLSRNNDKQFRLFMSRPKIQYGAESHTSMIFLLKLKKLLFIKSNQTYIKHSHSSNSHTKHYTIRNIIDPLQHGLTLPNPNRIQYFLKTTSSTHTFSTIKIYIYNSYNLLQQILRHFRTSWNM